MPRTHAAAHAASMPSSSRRALLKGGGALGTLAVLAVPMAVLPKAEACAIDPIFAVIAAHSTARTRLEGMDSSDTAWDATLDEEGALWEAFCACHPMTPGGLAAYAAHAAGYPDLRWLAGRDGPAQIIANMAEALRTLGVGGANA